jgi:hypothetical protein
MGRWVRLGGSPEFCDTTSDPTRERRLYIDTTFRVNNEQSVGDGDAATAAALLLRLNNLAATAVDVSAGRADAEV